MRGAFGKYSDGLVTSHCIPQFIDLITHAQLVFATDKNRIVYFAEPADQRPAFDPVIGNKSAARDARHDRNIDPTMVVCCVKDITADPYPFCGGSNPAGPANRKQEQAWPWGIQPEETPNIVK